MEAGGRSDAVAREVFRPPIVVGTAGGGLEDEEAGNHA
jgi:hypothetical protein